MYYQRTIRKLTQIKKKYILCYSATGRTREKEDGWSAVRGRPLLQEGPQRESKLQHWYG
jgi:hypothetical protein